MGDDTEVEFYCGPWDGENRQVPNPPPQRLMVPIIHENGYNTAVYHLYHDSGGPFYAHNHTV